MATSNSVNNKLGPGTEPTASLVMNSDGSMNLSQQPSFLIYLSTNAAAVTGAGTDYTIVFDQEVFSQGGSFSSGVYTASAAGNYLFTWGVTLLNGTISTATSFEVDLITTAAQFIGNNVSPSAIAPVLGGLTVGGSVITSMAEGHTAQINVKVSGLLTNAVTIAGGGAPVVTYFSGSMLN